MWSCLRSVVEFWALVIYMLEIFVAGKSGRRVSPEVREVADFSPLPWVFLTKKTVVARRAAMTQRRVRVRAFMRGLGWGGVFSWGCVGLAGAGGGAAF